MATSWDLDRPAESDHIPLYVLWNVPGTRLHAFGFIKPIVILYCKGLFKRTQHVGPTLCNIVGCNMLRSFKHHVG